MKRFPVLVVSLLVLLVGCSGQKHIVAAPPAETSPSSLPVFDKLILPDGTTLALGERVDPERLTPVEGGLYQVKVAYAVTALVTNGVVVGLLSPAHKGGTVNGFTFGSRPTDLGSGFNPASFGGQPAFVHAAPGGWFYAIEAGCPQGHLNLLAFVAEGHKANVEANVTISPCDPTHQAD